MVFNRWTSCIWTADWKEYVWYSQFSKHYLRSGVKAKGQQNSGLNGDSIPDLCDAGAVPYQLSYQAIRSCNFASRHWRNVQRVIVDIQLPSIPIILCALAALSLVNLLIRFRSHYFTRPENVIDAWKRMSAVLVENASATSPLMVRWDLGLFIAGISLITSLP